MHGCDFPGIIITIGKDEELSSPSICCSCLSMKFPLLVFAFSCFSVNIFANMSLLIGVVTKEGTFLSSTSGFSGRGGLMMRDDFDWIKTVGSTIVGFQVTISLYLKQWCNFFYGNRGHVAIAISYSTNLKLKQGEI